MRPPGRLLGQGQRLTPPSSFFVCANCRAARRAFSSGAPAPPAPSGLVALASRRLLSISGPDAPKFLQGATTQNILTAPAAASSKVRDTGFYSAFLTATGRVLYDVFIYPDHRAGAATATAAAAAAAAPGESFLVEVDAAEAARLERHIKRYKLRARFAVRLLAPDEATVWHGWNDYDNHDDHDAASVGGGSEDPHRFAALRDPRAPGLGWRMVTAGDAPPRVDLPRVADEDVYRVRRYLHGVAEGQAELGREAALPLEGNLDVMGAIDFRKGCYVGQELTIRTKHRGVVRKRVLPVMVYEEAAPPPQALVYDPSGGGARRVDAASIPADTSIGRLEKKGRSAGKWLRGVGNVGLALCRLEIMTDVVLPGETAATTYSPAEEFVMEQQPSEAGEGGFRVKVKAFVPEWLRQDLDQQRAGHK